MKHHNRAFVIGLALACTFAVTAPAFAQAFTPPAATGVPWGDAAADAIDYVVPVAFAALAFLLRRVPEQFRWVLVALRVEQMLGPAVQYGINATKGAVKGKVLSLPVGNEVANMALSYARQHAPQLVKMFGIERLREKILARLELDEDARIAPPAVTAQ